MIKPITSQHSLKVHTMGGLKPAPEQESRALCELSHCGDTSVSFPADTQPPVATSTGLCEHHAAGPECTAPTWLQPDGRVGERIPVCPAG